MDMNAFQFFFRWLHVIAGIVWIGHLYFFNLVNVPVQGILDDAAKKAVNPQLQPRALWWFRWGAMVTFLSGLLLYAMIYMYDPVMGFGMTGLKSPSGWIMMGMAFGIIMFALLNCVNTWLFGSGGYQRFKTDLRHTLTEHPRPPEKNYGEDYALLSGEG